MQFAASCDLVAGKTSLADAFIAVYGNIAGSVHTNADCPYFNRDSRALTVGGYDSRSSTARFADGHALVIDDGRRFQVNSSLQRILRNHGDDELSNVCHSRGFAQPENRA